MDRIKKVARVIPAGTWPDSASELTGYWVKRPPIERLAAGKELHLTNYRRLRGRPLPRMKRVARVIKAAR